MPTHVVTPKYRGKKQYFLAYSALVAAAHSRSLLTYAGIAHLTGLPTKGSVMAKEVGHLLGEISEDENDTGRPLLSALVVYKGDGTPSYGFYKLARQLGMLAGTSKTAEKAFTIKEQTKLFDFWK
jgi:hypothetical protein